MQLAANRWYVIATSVEVSSARPVALRRLGRDLVLWRDAAGKTAAAVDRCPHRWAKLSDGRVVQGEIECPFHGFRFERGGACTAIPAHPGRDISPKMHLVDLELREEQGFVWAWTGPDAAPDAPVPFFDFSGLSWHGSELTVSVGNHYTRAIENQLDFPHLPFVHRTTIGRFLGEEMEVVTEVEGDLIRAYLQDNPDGGLLEVLGPCIWRLKTGPVWQFLAFVPVDDERMTYYVRTYRKPMAIPGLQWLTGRIAAQATRFILNQDTRLVEGQPPGETRLRMGEVLVRSDGPIIAYRRWREEVRAPFAPGVE
jgi:phenylpropionate dioxygenase-like ring-hydroxylating dioxygenase large terminal subunit